MSNILDLSREHKEIKRDARGVLIYEQDGALFGWSDSNLQYERVTNREREPELPWPVRSLVQDKETIEAIRRRHLEFLAIDPDDGGLLD